jgi:hypothetical protein
MEAIMKSRFTYDSNTWTDPASDTNSCDDTATVECLQEALTHLLSKNQTLRFELYSVQQKLMRIESLLFGRDSSLLQQLIPADLLMDLGDLCKTTEENMWGTRWLMRYPA